MVVSTPKAAIEWICLVLPGRDVIPQQTQFMQRPNGLEVLTLTELKLVGDALKRKQNLAPHAKVHFSRSSKKAQWVHHIRACFFQDNTCRTVNEQLIKELNKEIQQRGNRSSSSTARPDSSGAKRKSRPTPSPGRKVAAAPRPNAAPAATYTHRPAVPSQQFGFPSTSVPGMMPNGIYFQNGASSTPMYASVPFFNPQNFPPNMLPAFGQTYALPTPSAPTFGGNKTATTTATPPSSSKSGSSKKESSSKKQKGNRSKKSRPSPALPAARPGLSPQAAAMAAATFPAPHETTTPTLPPAEQHERKLMLELMQSGFTNQSEVLRGIRAQSGPIEQVTSEQVLFWLLAERERRERGAQYVLEMEEARQMDIARLRSEADKQQNEEMRKKTEKERLEKATTIDQLKEIFPASWILKSSKNTLQDILKASKDQRRQFKQLLTLEAKAKKWYGVLPEPYFDKQCKELECKKSASKRTEWIQAECDRLQKGLFELENQRGGVPKMFLDARDSVKGVKGNTEVVLVNRKDGTVRACEVVEID